VLDNRRQVPYLMVWKDGRSDEVIEAVRVCAYIRSDSLDWTGWAEVKRTSGDHVLIRTIDRPLPRNGGKVRFVVCLLCQKPRCALDGWRVNTVRDLIAVPPEKLSAKERAQVIRKQREDQRTEWEYEGDEETPRPKS
jgi:hypothetical protein